MATKKASIKAEHKKNQMPCPTPAAMKSPQVAKARKPKAN